MSHVTNRAVKARLTAWKNFFQTGQGAPEDAEFGDDPLVDMAFKSPSLKLQDFAIDVELTQFRPPWMPARRATFREINAALGRTKAFKTVAKACELAPPPRGRRAVSSRELREALVG